MNQAHRALRDGTREAHETLDALFGGFRLDQRESYARFLAAHAEALLPIEAALDTADVAALIEDWPQRRRGALVRQDLASLGQPLPTPRDPPPVLDSTGAIAGMLYVIEGSRLGGRLLARSVADGLPTGYLDADQPSGNWRRLLTRLDAVLSDPAALRHATDMALEAFARFAAAGRRWVEAR